jgi:hypothetical protein
MAHRVSYELLVGPIADGMFVCHKCDVPSCVNPDHLFVGTPRDNIQDMFRKGRDNQPVGEQHGMARLTEQQVLEILESDEKHDVLARRYNICRPQITTIKNRKSWKHLESTKRAEMGLR